MAYPEVDESIEIDINPADLRRHLPRQRAGRQHQQDRLSR